MSYHFFHTNFRLKSLSLFFLALILIACNRQEVVFEAYQDLPSRMWKDTDTLTFSFEIKEPTLLYDLSYQVRNTIGYPFYNLYVIYELIEDKGKILQTKMIEANLMDATTGKPFGKGIGDLYDHRLPLLQTYRFEQAGTYRLRLRQYMRLEALPEIVAVGVHIAKTPTDE